MRIAANSVTRDQVVAGIAHLEQTDPGNPDLRAFRMLSRAMDLLGDLIYGDEDFRAAEKLIEEWEASPAGGGDPSKTGPEPSIDLQA